MTTPIPITAPKKDYSIVAQERNIIQTSRYFSYNLVDESGNQLQDEAGNDLVAAEILETYLAFHIKAPAKDYNIITQERRNG